LSQEENGMPGQRYNIKIENVVASAIISHKLDLPLIRKHLDNVTYNPEEFPALIYHQISPKASILVFNNGKLLCTGPTDINETEQAIFGFIQKIKKSGAVLLETINIEVQSIIATCDIKKTLDIDMIYKNRILDNLELSPDDYNVLVFRRPNSSITNLIFPSGKVVSSGGNNLKEIEDIFLHIASNLEKV
jgi:transcription initiation factor TFIID TATA-box-binding protein